MSRAALVALALVAGCVPAVAPLEAPVRAAAVRRGGAAALSDDELAAALGRLDRAAAVRVALARNPRVDAALADLGIAAGDVAAMRDVFSVHGDVSVRFFADGPPSVEAEVVHDLLGLVLVGPRRAAGAATSAAARARATIAILEVADRADLAYLAAAAAAERAALARTSFDAASAGADLAARIHAAGGTTDLALARAQGVREDARLALARADLDVELAREEVAAALGLVGGETRWVLAGELPALPDAAPALDDLEAAAVDASLELDALAADDTAALNEARIARVRTWLPELGVGVSIANEHDVGISAGPALRLGLPLTTAARGRAVAARATARKVERTRAATGVELRARARAARLEALATFDQARHLRDVIIPLRRRVLDELVLQYNAMNASPFELLVARRELAAGELDLVDARHRFAAAMVVVDALRRGAPPPDARARAATPMTAPPAADH